MWRRLPFSLLSKLFAFMPPGCPARFSHIFTCWKRACSAAPALPSPWMRARTFGSNLESTWILCLPTLWDTSSSERAMLGFVAASGIVSEPQARASREDVIRHFNAAGAAIGTARSSAQTALGSDIVFASSNNLEYSKVPPVNACRVSHALRRHAEVRPCFAGMISCCAVLSTTRARRARVSRSAGVAVQCAHTCPLRPRFHFF